MFIFEFLIILKVIGQCECFTFPLQPRAMGINDNYEKALQSYLQPIRKLAEDFPEHKVEVQLEILPGTSSRSKPTSKRILYMRKIQTQRLPLEQREMNEYSDDIIDPEPFAHRRRNGGEDKTNHAHFAQLAHHGHHAERHHPLLRTSPTPAESLLQDYQSGEGIAPSSPATETWLQHSSTELITLQAYPEQQTISLPNLVNAVYNAPAEVVHTTKRPVYMEDLKKVMDDFEKKLHVMHSDLHTSTTTAPSTKVSTTPRDAQEEAKRPVLKKDLWMALGMKYMTECPHDHNTMTTSQTTLLRAKIRQEEFMQRLYQNNSYSAKPGKLERIMNLLRKGVNIDRTQPKSADGNLQWLQIKIPKT